MEIIVKKYEHYNRTLGCYIKSKKHYQDEMKRQGMVDWDTGCRLADEHNAKAAQPYKLSEKAERVIREAVHNSKDGKVNMGSRLVEGMKDIGVKFDYYNTLPKHYQEGGFYEEKKA
jgi:hypothetical protein